MEWMGLDDLDFLQVDPLTGYELGDVHDHGSYT